MSCKLVDYSNMHALVAHPNHQLAEYIWHFLRDNGAANVQVAYHANSILPRLERLRFTHMLVGYDLGDSGGPDFVKLVRMLDTKTAEAPVIMVVTNPSLTKIMTCRDAGVNEIIATPLTGNQIHSRLRHLASRPKKFIRENSYIGPDRRRANPPVFNGVEQRRGEASAQSRAVD